MYLVVTLDIEVHLDLQFRTIHPFGQFFEDC